MYIHSSKTMGYVQELKGFEELVTVSSRCVEVFKQFELSYDFTSLGVPSQDISEVQLEFEPFFLFANEDPCVESLGWSVKKRKTPSEGVDLLVQKFTFKVPLTL